jgi:hypothetical protein
MIRWMSVVVALCATPACSGSTSDAARVPSSPEAPLPFSTDAFVGTWRSVTPSLEFIRLSVVSKSSEIGVLGARLTFSGVAWEGSGRIDGDSLVANMSIAGSTGSSSMLVIRARDARTLLIQQRHAPAPSLDLTLIREN